MAALMLLKKVVVSGVEIKPTAIMSVVYKLTKPGRRVLWNWVVHKWKCCSTLLRALIDVIDNVGSRFDSAVSFQHISSVNKRDQRVGWWWSSNHCNFLCQRCTMIKRCRHYLGAQFVNLICKQANDTNNGPWNSTGACMGRDLIEIDGWFR